MKLTWTVQTFAVYAATGKTGRWSLSYSFIKSGKPWALKHSVDGLCGTYATREEAEAFATKAEEKIQSG